MIDNENIASSTILHVKRLALIGVCISAALNSAGQIVFKAVRIANSETSIIALFLNYQTWIGFIIYGLSALCWLWVLARVPLSYAYPILALTFPIVVALSAIFFGETISTVRWIGVATIVVGVSLLART